MSTHTFFKYNPKKTFSAEEELVKSLGYPFVSTVTLRAPDDKRKKMARVFDHLKKHSHHSDNTHYIVSGRLDIHKLDLRFRSYPDKNGNRRIDVPHSVVYSAVAGPQGCTFVEGHKILSPTTAERFHGHRTLVYAKEGDDGAFEAVNTVREPRTRKTKKNAPSSEPTVATSSSHAVTADPTTIEINTDTPKSDSASSSDADSDVSDSDGASTAPSSVDNSPVLEPAKLDKAAPDMSTLALSG